MRGPGEIAAALRSLAEPSALATLVRTKGSSYRKPGARMVFHPGGLQQGGISAGCMETDVKERVAAVLESRHPLLVTFDLGSEIDLIWGTGMGCAGRAEVLLERMEPGQVPPWLEHAERLARERGSGLLATVFGTRGEVPAAPGDRFLFEGDRSLLPAPPALEAALRTPPAHAEARTARLEGGEVDLLLEPIRPPVALWVFGAGEHAMPLFRLAKGLGWFLGLADHRPGLATAARFPEANRIVVGHPPDSLQAIPFDARTAALVVSHVYEADKAALAAFLKAPLGYVGLQGNRRRSERILRELEEEDGPLTEEARSLLHYPAGLDIGAESPELIALSMISEVQASLAGRPGLPLRQWQGPIHPR
ncbi:XdhC family protein [Mesoterricola silvestris]|uniref:Xanthine dehydrogenase n=1 Tax=Mesoterricola silvestris TaxID=2927979 RepID=A0AA48GKV7_9BACT|nr:XdhC/CoxI family protein [Mesoterricola silvestris]BDU74936.1 hypothetical protein METEAL_41100 [Mesoterricola silvestris]